MYRIALACVLPLTILAGCHSDEGSSQPVSEQQFLQTRMEYERINPNARVGLVSAVLPSAHLASVGNVPVKDFTVGDVVSFIDSNGVILTNGTVEAIENNTLEVKYAPPQGKRNPAVGDMAVRAYK